VELGNLNEQVAREREERGWSYSQAGERGKLSRETWRVYERDGKLTATVRKGVARAFGWPLDWPENPVTMDAGSGRTAVEMLEEVLRRLDALERRFDPAPPPNQR
jgi:hypothetical protein